MMFWFKACPRCGGDLYSGADWHGDYIACVQCGYYLSEADELALRLLGKAPSGGPVEVARDEEFTVAVRRPKGCGQPAAIRLMPESKGRGDVDQGKEEIRPIVYGLWEEQGCPLGQEPVAQLQAQGTCASSTSSVGSPCEAAVRGGEGRVKSAS